MYLSVIIPAYNEAERLPETLVLMREYFRTKKFEFEIVVVDDGSTDETAQLVTEMIPEFPQLRLVSTPTNRGKGGAVKYGMLKATGKFRLFTDADYSTPITELEKFLPYFGKADVIIGSRYLRKDSIKVKQSFGRRLGSRGFNVMVRRLVVPDVLDTQCGFKVFSEQATDAIFPLQTMNSWSFDVEILTIAYNLGFVIKEVAVDWYDVKNSKFSATSAGLKAFQDLMKIHRNSSQGVYKA